MARVPILAAALALSSLGLGGCLSHASLSKPDLALPAAYDTPSVAASGLPTEALDRWWTLFDDPQLDALVQDALNASPDAKSAIGRLQEARADREDALYPFWPQGDPQVSAQNQVSQASGFAFYPSGALQTYTGQWNVSWELDLFGAIRAARRAANADLAAARFDYEATRISLAAEIATDLFQARGDAVELEEAVQDARIAHDLARSGRLKASAGLATTADSARLESDAEAADAQVLQLEAALRTAKRSVLLVAGRGAAPLDSLPIQARLGAPPAPPAATPGDLLTRRPDVREAEFELASAAGKLKLDKLQLFPNLTLQPGTQISKTAGAYMATTELWSIGANATAPVLDRPKLLAEIRAQRARGQQAVAAYEKAVQAAYGDAEKALTNLQADEARLERLRASESDARFAFDAATRGYKAGLTDLTTLLQAEQAWRSARAALTSANIAALQDAVTTFKALGGGWTPLGDKAALRKS